jgi:hypothetical protein
MRLLSMTTSHIWNITDALACIKDRPDWMTKKYHTNFMQKDADEMTGIYLNHIPRKSRRYAAGGTYLTRWMNWQMRGKAKQRREFPKRPSWLVKQALTNLKLRFWMEVSMWNPHHRGKHGNLSGGLQWIDFVLKYDLSGRQNLLAMILDYPNKRMHKYEQEYLATKKRRLDEKGIPYLILPIGFTSQEYAVKIANKIRQLKRNEILQDNR